MTFAGVDLFGMFGRRAVIRLFPSSSWMGRVLQKGDTMTKKYRLNPGYVISESDGDQHYINSVQLAQTMV